MGEGKRGQREREWDGEEGRGREGEEGGEGERKRRKVKKREGEKDEEKLKLGERRKEKWEGTRVRERESNKQIIEAGSAYYKRKNPDAIAIRCTRKKQPESRLQVQMWAFPHKTGRVWAWENQIRDRCDK